MPMAQTKLERVRQIRRWLDHRFPLPYPVTLQLPRFEGKRKNLAGQTIRQAGRTYVYVARNQSTSLMITTLFHEWAHARTEQRHTLEQKRIGRCGSHDDEFYLELGRVERGYFDGGGRRESGRF